MNICIIDALFCIPETILYTWNIIVNQLCFNKNLKNSSVEYSVPCPNTCVRAQVWNSSQFKLSCSRLWIRLHLSWKHMSFNNLIPLEQNFFQISLPAERCMFVIICLRCLLMHMCLSFFLGCIPRSGAAVDKFVLFFLLCWKKYTKKLELQCVCVL